MGNFRFHTATSLLFLGIIAVVLTTSSDIEANSNQSLEFLMTLGTDIDVGKQVFSQCTKCHGTEGWGSYSGDYPQLAGQHASVLIKQLIDIQSGKRENPQMLSITLELANQGSQAIANVAAYISTLKMNPDPGVGDAEDKDLIHVGKIYSDLCAKCHGQNGEGEADNFYPLLQGQHYEYLVRQLKLIQAGKRKNSNRSMQSIISKMNDRELEELADYISRLQPPAEKLAPYDWKNPDFL